MSQPPYEQNPNPGTFTHLLQSNPYASSPNQSNPSTPGSQQSNSSAPFPPYGTQMSSQDQVYQSQLAYHQNQPPFGYQHYPNLRNTQPQFFSQQFSQHSSQLQFKIPQAQEPRDPSRNNKKGKQPEVVELDVQDENEEMGRKRNVTRWNEAEEVLLAESWIEHSQDSINGNDQKDEIYWNKIVEDFNARTTGQPRVKNMLTGKWTRMNGDCQRFNGYYKQTNRRSGENDADVVERTKSVYLERTAKKFPYIHVWKVLKAYPKWDAPDPLDENNLEEIFGPDKRARPAGKPRAGKKQKSETSESTGGSNSSVSSQCEAHYKRKVEMAEKAYKVKMDKDKAIKKFEAMKFLMLDPTNLPDEKRAFIEKQQAKVMRKYQQEPDSDDDE